ncbi:exopolygalacturonase-like [Tripterygium wilfordii]|uniref:Exopolygalacturonase-like n=1 Tax=Tripterygium wilfordii TaxID=458696 RepID=A0A7J7D4Y7_TRIWF|nr:exopolygalacturonase-like [Tripterygium wilfordii]KAF5741381.1 exopolygalacturonase-like [Tripterygium wilfordii]
MGLKFNAVAAFLVFCILNANAQVFDITKYGAGGGDATQAVQKAWTEACASATPSKLVIPKGDFNVAQLKLEGPCKAPIEIQLQGTLKAPVSMGNLQNTDGWISISQVEGFTMNGGGVIDGQGAEAWKKNDCDKNPKCSGLPMNLRLNFITHGMITDVTTKDSKNFHVNVLGCKNITFQHFTVSAPETSINTDGIHIGRSVGVNIIDTSIQTGDDCVSIGDGSQQVSITGVTCGPGHGISIGSLGRYPNEEPVKGITVKNCTITKTMNGVRIKTWPASPPGSATDMHFEDITMNEVGNPILIDQGYCPYNQCTANVPSKVKISNVSFKNIRGTSSTKVVSKLACSPGLQCDQVVVSDIDLTYSGPEGAAESQCSNVKPQITGKQNPPACAAPATATATA